ncbi:MAG: tyrosine-type recombinase/integrase [Chloroflexi bacterium]|nr:tyrosine-type recombinase/integrase [Chloroflexota bacterium]
MSNLVPGIHSENTFDQFLADLQERGQSANTLRAYRLDWQHFTTWFAAVNNEPITLPRLTALDVQDYVTWSKREGFKATTINRRLGVLKQFVTWAEEQGLASSDQQRRIKKTKIVKKQPLAPKGLNAPQVRKLLNELERSGSTRDRAIVALLLFTGIRVGELCALTCGNVHLSERKGSLAIRAEVAKGGKERCVPMPKKAREALQEYLLERGDLAAEALVFVGRQGPISTAGVAAMLDKYAARIGLEALTPHVLRHTFAYNYLKQNNNDLVALADILGHSDLNTTHIYTKRRLDDLQAGVEQIEFF